MGIDAEEVHALEKVLVKAEGVAPKEARKVVARGLMNIKVDSRARIAGSKHFPRVAASINYETHVTLTGAWGVVGPEHGRPQANLAFIAENGSLHTAPQPFMRPAVEAEEPKFVKVMEALALKAAGLG
jgi:HK97 gp10 family phage protein